MIGVSVKQFAITAVFVSGLLACAVAQSAKGSNPLAIPTSQYWRCGFELLTPKDSAAHIALRYHFLEGDVQDPDREIETQYDSSGTPMSIGLVAKEVTANGEVWPRSMLVLFARTPADSAYGIRTIRSSDIVKQIPQSPVAVPKGWERLSREDTDKARALALWLRDNRCRRPPPGSHP
jgi:hypothetical protein